MVTKIELGKPFQAQHSKLIAYIPADTTVQVQISADGEHFDNIADPITGAETLQINDLKVATWVNFQSATEGYIKITL